MLENKADVNNYYFLVYSIFCAYLTRVSLILEYTVHAIYDYDFQVTYGWPTLTQ